ncbi:glycosyl hydrolase family 65 protein [Streptomyces beijiangensis]|uniref:Haloacid dehalogenase n=1 Tax=Streptomyces beijiangensis TaxID=163361 RepID=A0A939F525_9ACTN|nr:glycosyl hydrolase family 65 protein [Streptomyces beijiangensis]MBO0510525.1 haloacid dehalogenase [Streptomyces beijiangensis]
MSLITAPLLTGTLIAAVVPPSSAPVSTAAAAAQTVPVPACGKDAAGWSLTSTRPDPTVGQHPYIANGYLGHRVPALGTGYQGSDEPSGWPLYTPRYDGAFAAGLYAHNSRTDADRQAVAALPTWTGLEAGLGPGTLSHYRQTLFMACGVIRTSYTWTGKDGRATDLSYEVLADRSDVHTGAVRLRLTPRWDGDATVTDRIDGRGARRVTAAGVSASGRTTTVSFRADGTRTPGTVASTLVTGTGVHATTDQRSASGLSAAHALTFPVRSGTTYEIAKHIGIDSTPERASGASRRAAARGWQTVHGANAAAWAKLWASGITVPGQPDLQAWVRSAQYGLFTNSRAGSADSLAPTGLTSDNYAGEIFWDAETWMFPGLLATSPELAKSVVDYRYRTRAAAAVNAEKLGFKGLFFPWTSGSKGDNWAECHSWNPPHCIMQTHLQGDISLAVWQYYLATGDGKWLKERGWPLLKGIADYWTSRVTANDDRSYSIKLVAGPDEYSNGVTDGVYTNAVAATALRNAAHAATLLDTEAPARWTEIADRLRIPYDTKAGVFEQYAGYKGSLIKQADTVLLLYPLDWKMTKAQASRTLAYYAQRTDPAGPAMTDSVHAVASASIGSPGCATYTYLQRAIRPYVRGDFDLFSEAKGDKAGADDALAGHPAMDFLTGKGGFLQTFTHGLTGMRLQEDGVRLDPMLPPQLPRGVTLHGLRWQGRTYSVAIGPKTTRVTLTQGAPFTLHTPQGDRRLTTTIELPTRRPDLTATGNTARCRPATATSEQPGLYAAAAVDGDPATTWSPESTAKTATLTVDLGPGARDKAKITPDWETRPTSFTATQNGRYVHLTVHGPAVLRELEVSRGA